MYFEHHHGVNWVNKNSKSGAYIRYLFILLGIVLGSLVLSFWQYQQLRLESLLQPPVLVAAPDFRKETERIYGEQFSAMLTINYQNMESLLLDQLEQLLNSSKERTAGNQGDTTANSYINMHRKAALDLVYRNLQAIRKNQNKPMIYLDSSFYLYIRHQEAK